MNNTSMKQTPQSRHAAGFTITEVLVALALLALVLAAIVTPMFGLFNFSRGSQDILSVNSTAQKRLDEARVVVLREYSDPAAFKTELARLKVECTNMSLYGTPLEPAACDKMTGDAAPPLRRLTTRAQENKQEVTVSVDVVKP